MNGCTGPKPSERVRPLQGPEPLQQQTSEPQPASSAVEAEPESLRQPPAGLETQEIEEFIANQAAKNLGHTGTRTPRMREAPDDPTPEERASHELTHIPFARWCQACVRTRSRTDKHHEVPRVEPQLSVIQVDFYFTSSRVLILKVAHLQQTIRIANHFAALSEWTWTQKWCWLCHARGRAQV